jgi:hypothetical protein
VPGRHRMRRPHDGWPVRPGPRHHHVGPP